jgi:hypothetical protein
MGLVDELKAHEAATADYVKTLEGYAAAARSADLHFLPTLPAGGAEFQIVNFTPKTDEKDAPPRKTTLVGVPAALLYEAYRSALPEIFARAIEQARGSLAAKAKELKAKIEGERAALYDAEVALNSYLDGGTSPVEAPKRKTAGAKR